MKNQNGKFLKANAQTQDVDVGVCDIGLQVACFNSKLLKFKKGYKGHPGKRLAVAAGQAGDRLDVSFFRLRCHSFL